MTTSVKNDDNQFDRTSHKFDRTSHKFDRTSHKFDWKLYGYLMGLKAAKRREMAKQVQEYRELLPDEPPLDF